MRTCRRALLAVALLLAASWVPGALAAGEDDAGSGRDAGDVSATGVRIGAGTWHGNLTSATDVEDTFVVALTSSNLLRLTLTAPAGVLLRLQGPTARGFETFLHVQRNSTESFPVPATGDWLVEAVLATNAPGGRASYALVVGVSSPPGMEHLVSRARWNALEASWSQAADVHAYQRIDVPAATDAPATVLLSWQYEVTVNGVYFAGSDVRAVHIAASGSYAAYGGVAIESPVHVEVDAAAATIWLNLAVVPGSIGWIRLVAVDAGTRDVRPNVQLSIAATRPLVAAEAWGDSTVAWGASDTAGVAAPGAATYGARSKTLNVTGPFYGIFLAHDETGRSTDPSGATRLQPPRSARFLLRPAAGTWTFALDASVAAGPETSQLHLVGAFVPDLGVPRP